MSGFGIEHLPYGVFARRGEEPRVGVRFGSDVLDLSPLGEVFAQPNLNAFMAQGPSAWEQTRDRAREVLERGVADLVPLVDARLQLPFAVADYVDFYSSLGHATNMGRMFRPNDDPLLPNWRWLPIGYHGRAGTVVVSGTPVARPSGQARLPDAERPTFGPTRRLDVELELGVVIGTPSGLGGPVSIERSLEHVFGVVLVNDWSARDIQAWEYQPLGPFLGKSFATSIGAWVTPLAALERYRVAGAAQEPAPLEHLRAEPRVFDLHLELELNGDVVSRTNAQHVYWSVEQQIAHLTSNGGALRTGDLLASGTISGDAPGTEGSLIELWRGERFVEDGDEVVLRGRTPDGAVELAEVSGRVIV
jgi:fumarylacetoacetase